MRGSSVFVHVNSSISESTTMVSVGPDTSPLESATTGQNTIMKRRHCLSTVFCHTIASKAILSKIHQILGL